MTFNLFLFSFLLAAEMRKVNLPDYVLWFSMPAMIIGFVALIIVVLKFIKMFGEARICRVPLRESSEIDITATGKLNVCFEAPAFSVVPSSGLDYKLTRLGDGQAIELLPTPAMLVGGNNGSTASYPIREFQIEETGKYLLEVSGFNPQKDYSSASLVISRPTSLKTIYYIFAIIFTGGMFIGGLVFSLIALSPNK